MDTNYDTPAGANQGIRITDARAKEMVSEANCAIWEAVDGERDMDDALDYAAKHLSSLDYSIDDVIFEVNIALDSSGQPKLTEAQEATIDAACETVTEFFDVLPNPDPMAKPRRAFPEVEEVEASGPRRVEIVSEALKAVEVARDVVSAVREASRVMALSGRGHESVETVLNTRRMNLAAEDSDAEHAAAMEGFNAGLHERRVIDDLATAKIKRDVAGLLAAEGAPKLKIMSIGQFLSQPPLQPLIPDFLYLDTLSRMFGEPGCGKTFVSIDMAMAVALGRRWAGREVVRKPVIYVMAEGQAVNGDRVRAYMKHYGVTEADLSGWFYAVPHEVMLTLPALKDFLERVAEIEPGLVVLDTKNAMMVGDENSATDFATMRRAMNEIKRVAGGACVLLIDHTGYGNTGRARGSSAARGGMDTEIAVTKDKKRPIVVSPDRDKSSAESDLRVAFDLHSVTVDPDRRDSAVAVPALATPSLTGAIVEYEWKTHAIPAAIEGYRGKGESYIPTLARYMAYYQEGGDAAEVGMSRAEAMRGVNAKTNDRTAHAAWSYLLANNYIVPAPGNTSCNNTGRHIWAGE